MTVFKLKFGDLYFLIFNKNRLFKKRPDRVKNRLARLFNRLI
jgi:hypothetical protein